jgi:hypothetical protein
MLYAIKLGPIETTDEGRVCAYLGYAKDRGEMPPAFAAGDLEGLRELLEHAGERELCCEPALAPVGRRLGFRKAPIPDWVLPGRAETAFALAMGSLAEDPREAPFDQLLRAAAVFWQRTPWRRLSETDLMRVDVTGGATSRYYAMVMGARRQEHGLALYAHEDIVDYGSFSDMDDIRREAELMSNIAVTLYPGPPWAMRAVRDAYRLPAMPAPIKLVRGEPRKIGQLEILTLAAAMEAISQLSPAMVEGKASVSGSGQSVTVQIRS